jgi:dipeptidyl aminopeptidase/acylaminoacyl peptidase
MKLELKTRNLQSVGFNKHFFIEQLLKMDFKGSSIRKERVIAESNMYHTYNIEYLSDGIKVQGSMRRPNGKGPFSAILINHGHSRSYKNRDDFGLEEISRLFVQEGYITFSTDYRNYGKSDRGPDIFQEGYFNDVMNLLASIEKLSEVDSDKIGMCGHSMGGAFTIKAALIAGKIIKAVSVFAPMSTNEIDNYKAITNWHPEKKAHIDRTFGTPESAAENYQKMSPCYYLELLKAPVIIHHGADDDVVPIEWSEYFFRLCKGKNKAICIQSYRNTGHDFKGETLKNVLKSTIEFFKRYGLA